MAAIYRKRFRPVTITALAAAVGGFLFLHPTAAQDPGPHPEQTISRDIADILIQAQAHMRQQEHSEAIEAIDAALAARQLAPGELGVALYLRGQANYALGDAHAAATDWTRALDEGQLTEAQASALRTALDQVQAYLDDDSMGGFVGVVSNLYFEAQEALKVGDIDRADDLLRRAVSAAEAEGDLNAQSLAYGGFGYSALGRGDWEGALQSFERSAALAEQGHSPPAIFRAALFGKAQAIYMGASINGGDLAEAEAAFLAILPHFEEGAHDPSLIDTLGNLGSLAADREDYATAADYFEQALEHADALNDTQRKEQALIGAATIAFMMGDARGARERLERLNAEAEAAGDPLLGAQLLEQAAVAHRRQGRAAVACWLDDKARDTYRLAGQFGEADAMLGVLEATDCPQAMGPE